MPTTILIGGPNEMKFCAATAAAARVRRPRLCIKQLPDVKVPADHEQPICLEETRAGALRRALACLDADPSAEHAIGAENGLMPAGDGCWFDIAVIAVVTRGGKVTYTTSNGIACPVADVGTSIATNQSVTAGKLIAARTGCDPADWHSFFTGGLVGRETILTDAMYLAFVLHFTQR